MTDRHQNITYITGWDLAHLHGSLASVYSLAHLGWWHLLSLCGGEEGSVPVVMSVEEKAWTISLLPYKRSWKPGGNITFSVQIMGCCQFVYKMLRILCYSKKKQYWYLKAVVKNHVKDICNFVSKGGNPPQEKPLFLAMWFLRQFLNSRITVWFEIDLSAPWLLIVVSVFSLAVYFCPVLRRLFSFPS